ncbi:NitT/TauT family transport system permease protein [Halobiforma haloterrestris]|uniref:NitT/TauT family transport system permease protein n=1 Tax=Natronobacterium haloterrestre TaxID=148448 RepID=A0A1I1LAK7_NATHA|nr:ABC transporter permease [Halobiforma haloterrestris]SFC70031.1 NitT/TauT family transport system permease protein [Halobiforma haloterrestris]
MSLQDANAVTTAVSEHLEWETVRRIGFGLVGTLALTGLWAIAAASVSPGYLIPGPRAVAAALVTEFRATEPLVTLGFRTDLPRAILKLGQTFAHYVPGLAVGAVLGAGTGVAMGWDERLDDLLTPAVRVLRPIPPLAWIVFAIVWFGIGHGGAVFIVGIGAFWINFYGGYDGVRDVPDHLLEVAESLGTRSDFGMIRLVVVPAALPSILTAFRTSLGRCLMIVVGAELFGAPGVGFEIINAANNLAMATSVAYMLVISSVHIGLDVLYRRAERRLLEWQP